MEDSQESSKRWWSILLKICLRKIDEAECYGCGKFVLKGNELYDQNGCPLRLTCEDDLEILSRRISHSSFSSAISEIVLVGCSLNHRGVEIFCASWNFICHLDLTCNPLGSRGAEILGDHFKKCRLKTINLSNTRLVDIFIVRSQICGRPNLEGIRKLLQGLENSSTIKFVDLSRNYLGGIFTGTSSSMSHHIKAADHSDEELDYGPEIAVYISSMLADNNSLTDMNIVPNGFENSPLLVDMLLTHVGSSRRCKSLCGLGKYRVKDNNSPTTIWLSGQNHTPFTGSLLGREIFQYQFLTDLDISSNLEVSVLISFAR